MLNIQDINGGFNFSKTITIEALKAGTDFDNTYDDGRIVLLDKPNDGDIITAAAIYAKTGPNTDLTGTFWIYPGFGTFAKATDYSLTAGTTGLIAYNGGSYFNDGDDDDVVNGVAYGSGASNRLYLAVFLTGNTFDDVSQLELVCLANILRPSLYAK